MTLLKVKFLFFCSAFLLSLFSHAQTGFLSGIYIDAPDTVNLVYSEENIWINDSTALVEIEGGTELAFKASIQSVLYLSGQKVQVLKIDGKWIFVNTLIDNGKINLYKTLVSSKLIAQKGDSILVFELDRFKSDLQSFINDNQSIVELIDDSWVEPYNLNQFESIAVSVCQQYNNVTDSTESQIQTHRIQYKRLATIKAGLSNEFGVFTDGVLTNFFSKNIAIDLGFSIKFRSYRKENMINNLVPSNTDVNLYGLILPFGVRYYLSRKTTNISLVGGAEVGMEFFSSSQDGKSKSNSAESGIYLGLGMSWPINTKQLIGFEMKYATLENFGSFNVGGTFTF
ncbi:hypothetical protein SAMN04488029_0266 [Reichenbachiella faecimaris]|uniref:Outer membrane protein beta-barrel domain-containing protein n=1 Tax=Reichenbachiella faecimaris TaxID=692418 RepID=A0A1W2G6F4_REIFA|nr:hypothetical protein [Reichenbachiella faecimaris]SMD31928.1 hypothetical protein SAMN04488029_0266 [Reichenbachiella faecimaris]